MTATARVNQRPTPAANVDWQAIAACRDHDPELFFPIGTSGPALLQTEQAKAVCRGCPVIEECLAWALQTGVGFGIWGATTEAQRRAITRREGTQPAQVDQPDEVAARRALNGDQAARAQLTDASRREAVRLGLAQGLALYTIARRLHTNYHALKAVAAELAAEQETGASA